MSIFRNRKTIMFTLLLTAGMALAAQAAPVAGKEDRKPHSFTEKVGDTFRKIFKGHRNAPKNVKMYDLYQAPAVPDYASTVPGHATLESLFFELDPDIPVIGEELRFTDFSGMPEEYDIWNTHTINPYNVSLTGMTDTVKIDVSSYCPPTRKYVTSNWGFRRWRFHYGIDLKVHRGDTVKCAFDGTVRITRRERGYGYFVVVRHDNGLETLYAHLDRILVKQDARIKAGEAIGMGGNTGRSTGYHLHFEFRYLGVPINPNDIVNFETHEVHKPVFTLTKQNFAYKKEIDKIRYWTVRSGDTLGRIAYRTGVSVSKLCSLNGISRNTILRIGRKIRYT